MTQRTDDTPPREAAIPPPLGPDLQDRGNAAVPLRARRDGWTADRQSAFLAALRAGAWVATAAAEVGMSRESAYRLRRNPRAAGFARDWAAIEAARNAGSTLGELLDEPGRDDAVFAARGRWLAEMERRPDFTRWLIRRLEVLSNPTPKRRVV